MKIAWILLLLTACATLPKSATALTPEAKAASDSNTCPKTIMVGWTSEADMSSVDRSCYERAKIRCPQLYKNSPCLKKFERRAPETYWVTCGAKR